MTLSHTLRWLMMSQTLLLSGCALPFFGDAGGAGLNKEPFAAYVEGVFRLQNRMTSEVMMLTAAEDDPRHSGLLQAEQQMRQACAPLNEYASRDIDGLGASLTLRRQVVKSARACDSAAHVVEGLLKP